MTYAEKLRDPRWQRKRLEILSRDEWACVNCRTKSKTLHVHHDQYKGEPWDAPSHCLFTLCEDCHLSAHSGRVNLLAWRIMPGGFTVKRTQGDGKFFLDRLFGNIHLMGTELGEYEVREYPNTSTVIVLYPLEGKCTLLRNACQFARAVISERMREEEKARYDAEHPRNILLSSGVYIDGDDWFPPNQFVECGNGMFLFWDACNGDHLFHACTDERGAGWHDACFSTLADAVAWLNAEFEGSHV